jgi:hypothetical protein
VGLAEASLRVALELAWSSSESKSDCSHHTLTD